MAILVLKEKEQQKSLIFVLIGLIFLTFFVIWLGVSKRPGILVAPPPKPKKIEIDFSVLESPILKELEIFEEISWPEEKGRENPFLPY